MTESTKAMQPVAKRRPRKHKNSTHAELENVLRKFSFADQVQIRRNAADLPRMIATAWRDNFKRLDLREIQQHSQVLGNDALHLFLRKMRRHFRSVRFVSAQLQSQLNILDRFGISLLPGVRKCEICTDDAKSENYTHWPLQALPKLMPRLSTLHIHIPVQVGFIEQFTELKSLAIYNEVSSEALAAIWLGCKRLECMKIFGHGRLNTLGISTCPKLCELILPVGCFNVSSAFEILQMTQLQFLELQHTNEANEDVIESMSLVLRQRANDIQLVQLNGTRLGLADWFFRLDLQLCPHLEGLTLIGCQFGALNAVTIGLLAALTYIAFCQCLDIQDIQVLEFVKACPKLTELYLVNCPQLTKELLYNLCNFRCKDKCQPGQPLQLYLEDCQPLSKEYEEHFLKQKTLKLLEMPQQDHQMQHVQFFFLSPESKE